MKKILRFAAILFSSVILGAVAATAAEVAVPRVQLPGAIVAELRQLENQFELALSQDCPGDKCFSRGCVYLSHETVDKPRSRSLPGLGEPEGGPGSVQSQEHLTGVRCELAVESTIASKDVSTLVKRLEQKLSRGYLIVSIEAKALPPLPFGLKQTPTPTPQTPVATPTPAVAVATPKGAAGAILSAQESPKWTFEQATRELWLSLLPHFSWMIAVVLGTSALMLLIWAWRRLGQETLEEKAMLASLAQSDTGSKDKLGSEATALAGANDPRAQSQDSLVGEDQDGTSAADASADDARFVRRQAELWRVKLEGDSKVFNELAAEWLKQHHFPLIAKLLLNFDLEVTEVLPARDDTAQDSLLFADYMRQMDHALLPSDATFFRSLQKHSVAAAVAGNSSLEVYARLRDEFGASELASLIARMPPRLGAILLSLAPSDFLGETSLLLEDVQRREMTLSLISSNRVSPAELSAVVSFVKSACSDSKLPENVAVRVASGVQHGRTMGVERVLGALLPRLSQAERKQVIEHEKARFGGTLPQWCLGIFYPEMLTRVPADMRNQMLLQLEPRELATWLTDVSTQVRVSVLREAPASLAAVLQSFGGPVAGEAATLAKAKVQGRLVELMRREYAAGHVKFEDLI